jgi:hypothetical protein
LGIIKKIVFEDIPIIFPVENPEILYAIVKIVAELIFYAFCVTT